MRVFSRIEYLFVIELPRFREFRRPVSSTGFLITVPSAYCRNSFTFNISCRYIDFRVNSEKMFAKVIGLCVVIVCLLDGYANGLTTFRRHVYDSKKYEESTTSGSLEDIKQNEKEYVISDEKLPWYEARFSCLAKGLRLASPLNPHENQKLLEYIRENGLVPADKFAGYWIGGFRRTDGQPWLWTSTETQVGDLAWLPGEPNYYTGEDCIELKNDEGRLGWNNYYCSERKRYICEKIVNEDLTEAEKADVASSQDFHTERVSTVKEKEKHELMASKEGHLKADEIRSESSPVKEKGDHLDDDLVTGDETGSDKRKEEAEAASTDQEPEEETSVDPVKVIGELDNEDFLTLENTSQSDEENAIDHGL